MGLYLFFLIIGILSLVGGIFNIRVPMDIVTINNPIEYFFGRKARRIFCVIIGVIFIVVALAGVIKC